MTKKVDPDQLIGPEEVAPIIGLTNQRGVSVYRKRPGFPAPIIDKGRCVLWLRADIERWARARLSARG
ncbi:MAG: Prophage regulatory protein (AlpA) [Ilumatobacteraceae bacterium]|nr:Prophage regulatory protein (AlpA) [Ilumatobacteraceae bacterium]